MIKKRWLFILLLVLGGLTILFVPIPSILRKSAQCQPCAPGLVPSQCPKCPQKGDVEWRPSLARTIWGRLSRFYPESEGGVEFISPSKCQPCTGVWDTNCPANQSCFVPNGQVRGVCLPVLKMGQVVDVAQVNQQCGTNFPSAVEPAKCIQIADLCNPLACDYDLSRCNK